MTTQHTPGPWHIGLDGMSIVADAGDSPHGIPIRPCVATVKRRLDGTEANARLIATAPDLLEALQEYLDWHRANFALPSGNLEDPDQTALAKKGSAAIAKARGEG